MNARQKLAIKILLWVAKALWDDRGYSSISTSLYTIVEDINKTLQGMDECQEESG